MGGSVLANRLVCFLLELDAPERFGRANYRNSHFHHSNCDIPQVLLHFGKFKQFDLERNKIEEESENKQKRLGRSETKNFKKY